MNYQEAFNKAYLGVIQQGRKSGHGQSCLYRDGTAKCGIGHLIPDEHYKEDFESWGVTFNVENESMGEALEAGGFPDAANHLEFLSALQAAHDFSDYPFINQFKVKMRVLAQIYHLTIPEV